MSPRCPPARGDGALHGMPPPAFPQPAPSLCCGGGPAPCRASGPPSGVRPWSFLGTKGAAQGTRTYTGLDPTPRLAPSTPSIGAGGGAGTGGAMPREPRAAPIHGAGLPPRPPLPAAPSSSIPQPPGVAPTARARPRSPPRQSRALLVLPHGGNPSAGSRHAGGTRAGCTRALSPGKRGPSRGLRSRGACVCACLCVCVRTHGAHVLRAVRIPDRKSVV